LVSWKGKTKYRKQGKLLQAITDQQFSDGLEHGHFTQRKHKGYAILLWLTGLRRSEVLELKKEQFLLTSKTLFIDTGVRKKKKWFTKQGKPKTPMKPDPLPLPLEAPHMNEILYALENTKPGERVFPFSASTAYNITSRGWNVYPHYFRLSRITNFLEEGYELPDIKNWTSLTVSAIDSYVGKGKLKSMGESLAIKK